MTSAADPRKADEYRIPAASLRPGDLVNLAPGEDDWQEVRVVHTSAAGIEDAATKTFVESLNGQYVYVEVTDVASVDNTIYVDADGVGRINDDSDFGSEDSPVSEIFSEPDAVRIYLFTKYELVTVRAS